jgi:succinate dehydrogenase/fumarate reductase flavoprotein subunit
MIPYAAIVIGSGFGGAVTACRLAEKGMKVLVNSVAYWTIARRADAKFSIRCRTRRGTSQVPAASRLFPVGNVMKSTETPMA